MGYAVGVDVKACEAGAAALELENGAVAARGCLRAHHVGEVLRVGEFGHVSPYPRRHGRP